MILAIKTSIENHVHLGLAWAFLPVTLEIWDRGKLSIVCLVPPALWLPAVRREPCAGQ